LIVTKDVIGKMENDKISHLKNLNFEISPNWLQIIENATSQLTAALDFVFDWWGRQWGVGKCLDVLNAGIHNPHIILQVTWKASTQGTIAEVIEMSSLSMDNVHSQEPEKAAPLKNWAKIFF
jgi:hypothetical protein